MPRFTAVDVVRVAARSTAVHISLLAAAVLPSICRIRYWLPEYCRECAVGILETIKKNFPNFAHILSFEHPSRKKIFRVLRYERRIFFVFLKLVKL